MTFQFNSPSRFGYAVSQIGRKLGVEQNEWA